jgi:hypothetical protein
MAIAALERGMPFSVWDSTTLPDEAWRVTDDVVEAFGFSHFGQYLEALMGEGRAILERLL